MRKFCIAILAFSTIVGGIAAIAGWLGFSVLVSEIVRASYGPIAGMATLVGMAVGVPLAVVVSAKEWGNIK